MLRRAAAAPFRAAAALASHRGVGSDSTALCVAAETATRAWLNVVLRSYALCPFAPPDAAVRVVATPARSRKHFIEAVAAEAELLAGQPAGQPATTLLVAPRCGEALQFVPFLKLLGEAEDKAERHGLQFVAFHPLWHCRGEELEDAAAYTNRTPFPTVHLLRCRDVAAAVEAAPGAGEEVPARNAALLRGVGAPSLQTQLESIREAALREALLGNSGPPS